MKTVFRVIRKNGSTGIWLTADDVAVGFRERLLIASSPLTVTDSHYEAIVKAQMYYAQVERSLGVKRKMQSPK